MTGEIKDITSEGGGDWDNIKMYRFLIKQFDSAERNEISERNLDKQNNDDVSCVELTHNGLQ